MARSRASIAFILCCVASTLSALALASHAQAKTVVLLVHGGGWKGGSPDTMIPLRDDLRARGIAAKVVSYKVDGGYIPAELTNLRRAARAEKRAGNDVILYGTSAGAQLSAALAARGEVAGAVLVSAPTDLLNWRPEVDGARSLVAWAAYGMTAQQAADVSPINRLTKRASPTLLLHGDADALVPLEQGMSYYHKARRFQKDTRMIPMRGVQHEFPYAYWARAAAWIKRRS